MNKKNISLVVLLAVLVVGVFAVRKYWGGWFGGTNEKVEQQQKVATKFGWQGRILGVTGQLPLAMPQDLPVLSLKSELQNFETKTPSGVQYAYQYISGESLAKAFAAYKKYLADKKWTLLNSSDQPEIKSLFAQKDSAKMSISLSRDSTLLQNVINIAVESPELLGFPADFPREKEVKIEKVIATSTVSTTAPLQYTLEYNSANTVDANLKIFKDYFEKGGWGTRVDFDLSKAKALTAFGVLSDIFVNISADEKGVVSVKVLYTIYPKEKQS